MNDKDIVEKKKKMLKEIDEDIKTFKNKIKKNDKEINRLELNEKIQGDSGELTYAISKENRYYEGVIYGYKVSRSIINIGL